MAYLIVQTLNTSWRCNFDSSETGNTGMKISKHEKIQGETKGILVHVVYVTDSVADREKLLETKPNHVLVGP